jgi:hypothetical protein
MLGINNKSGRKAAFVVKYFIIILLEPVLLHQLQGGHRG